MQDDHVNSYEQVVANELATKVQNDSLFLGFTFGMLRDDFYTWCQVQNKEGVLYDSGVTLRIAYDIESIEPTVQMNFNARFTKDQLNLIEAELFFKSWTAWDKKLRSDKLLPLLLAEMDQWFPGKRFQLLTNEAGEEAYYKIQGNRVVKAWIKNLQFVNVEVRNLQE